MHYFLGIDIGSLTTKAVILDPGGRMVTSGFARSGYQSRETALQLVKSLLAGANIDDGQVRYTVATGYGRITFPADREVSEITCQAKGIFELFPTAKTVIDIGGQDSKVIRLLAHGKVGDFAMNDKCAAGTGRFLEVMAGALETGVEELGRLALQATFEATVSSICTVFAESEVISQIAKQTPKEAIARGICRSVASRVALLAKRVGVAPDVVFTGGVAKNPAIVKLLQEELQQELLVPDNPTITAALGAARFALEYGK